MRKSTLKRTVRKVSPKIRPHVEATFDKLNPNAAGIDLGSRDHFVAINPLLTDQPIRSFSVYTADLHNMAAWLKQHHVETVAMEATGVYWVSAYDVLEAAGFEVLLVDAKKIKNVSGKKTDVADCEWIRKLHYHGLLSSAFVPSATFRALRCHWRERQNLVKDASRCIQHMQKALEQMNIQIHKAVSDIAGISGMRLIRAILEGVSAPEKLLKLVAAGVKATAEEITAALDGNRKPEQLFALRQAVERYDFFHQQIHDLDMEIQKKMAEQPTRPAPTLEEAAKVEPTGENPAPAAKNPKKNQRKASQTRRKNEPHFDLAAEQERIMGVSLAAIEGIGVSTVQVLLAELGADWSRFPTAGHFVSWLGLCPNPRITGGKVHVSRTSPVKNRVAAALRIAAQSLHSNQSALGAFFRRMAAHKGSAKAITATARKLAERCYRMMTKGGEYERQGAAEYDARYAERRHTMMVRAAKESGYGLINLETGELVAS